MHCVKLLSDLIGMRIGIYSTSAGPASGESAQGRGQKDLVARKDVGGSSLCSSR
jgi:hypothetical protein